LLGVVWVLLAIDDLDSAVQDLDGGVHGGRVRVVVVELGELVELEGGGVLAGGGVFDLDQHARFFLERVGRAWLGVDLLGGEWRLLRRGGFGLDSVRGGARRGEEGLDLGGSAALGLEIVACFVDRTRCNKLL